MPIYVIGVTTGCSWCASAHPNKTMSIKDYTHFPIYYFTTKFSRASLRGRRYKLLLYN